jgi:Flp pilus assembly protein TadG
MRNRHAGQSLVEMALLSTLLVSLLLGAVDFARAYQAQVAIKNAIAEAGYFAAQNPGDDAGIRRSVKAELSGFDPVIEDGDIVITRSCATGAEQTLVRLQYDYQLLFSFVVPGAVVTLGSETTVPQMGGC